MTDQTTDSDLHAAIDVGTNSVHLVVARQIAGGGFEVITSEKESVRLGAGGDMRTLQPDAIDRAVAALTRMVGVARSLGAEVSAVATSAVREAKNRAEFLDRVRDEIGLEVSVISGLEEARLIHHGVIHALPVGDQRTITVDIGGGSTELIIGQGTDLINARSLRLGAIRLTERFFGAGPKSLIGSKKPIPAEAVARCRRYLQESLHGTAADLGGQRIEMAIGSSGTITAVATVVAAMQDTEPRQMNGFTFTINDLDRAVERILAAGASERRDIPGLDDKRSDIIVGGILLLQEIFAAFGLTVMQVSEYALREGVLFDRFPQNEGHLLDLRRSNALRLADLLDTHASHAVTTARLAVDLFDRTASIHRLGAPARELLEIAAIVHNVGAFISHSGHHKHTYYVIRNTEHLTGFHSREIELIAQIARYHRRSLPSEKHPYFAALNTPDRQLVELLAGMLRVAVGLDRRHTDQVQIRSVHASQRELMIAVEPRGQVDHHPEPNAEPAAELAARPGADNDIALEVYAANDRSKLLSRALGLDVTVTSS